MKNDVECFSLTCDGTASIQTVFRLCGVSGDLLERTYPWNFGHSLRTGMDVHLCEPAGSVSVDSIFSWKYVRTQNIQMDAHRYVFDDAISGPIHFHRHDHILHIDAPIWLFYHAPDCAYVSGDGVDLNWTFWWILDHTHHICALWSVILFVEHSFYFVSS